MPTSKKQLTLYFFYFFLTGFSWPTRQSHSIVKNLKTGLWKFQSARLKKKWAEVDRTGFVIVCVKESGCQNLMKVTNRSDFVWMPPNHFNLHLSTQGNWFINHGCICHQCGFQPTNRQKGGFSWWGQQWFMLLGTRSLPLHVPPSLDTRWCHGSLLACKCIPNNASTVTIPPFVTGYVHYPQLWAQN